MKYLAYALSTVDDGSPRVRYVIHRSIILPTPTLPLLVSTTDIRTPKVSQLVSSDSDSNVGVAWWFESAAEQYRITARAHLLPNPANKLYSRFPVEELAPPFIEDAAQWWENERIATFDNKMGGALRASFCRPIPGSDLPGGYESGAEWPETLPRSTEVEENSKEDKQVHEALENFSLVVLAPREVERLELGVVPNRRTRWTLVGEDWTEKILVP